MIVVKARFDGRVFIPKHPVDLPAGSETEITVRTGDEKLPVSTLAALAQIAKDFPSNPDLPADLASEHDHYLYGTPKRS